MDCIYIVGILSIVVLVLIYLVYINYRKVAKQEEIIESHLRYFNILHKYIKDSRSNLDKIDHKGSFESDDEVGYFFETLKSMQITLDSLGEKINYGEEEQ